MAWTNVTKPTTQGWTDVPKPSNPNVVTYSGGDPIGLLLALTYSTITNIAVSDWVNVTKPTTASWTTIPKPTT